MSSLAENPTEARGLRSPSLVESKSGSEVESVKRLVKSRRRVSWVLPFVIAALLSSGAGGVAFYESAPDPTTNSTITLGIKTNPYAPPPGVKDFYPATAVDPETKQPLYPAIDSVNPPQSSP